MAPRDTLGAMLFEHALDAVFLTEPTGRILEANPAACEMFRADVETLRALGRDGIVDHADPRFHTALAERSATGSTRARYRMRRANGETFESDVSSRIFSTPNGGARTVTIVRELTELQRLAGSEESYRALFMHAFDAIAVIDLTGTLIDINDAGAALLGLSRDEVHGAHFDSFVPEAEREKLAELFGARQAGDTGARRYETLLRGRDGTEIPVEVTSAGRVEGDTPRAIMCVIRDLRNERLLAAERREREERYSSLVSALTEGIVMQDSDGTILACNAAAEQILGLSEDQLAGRTSLDPRWRAVHEDGSPFPGDTHPAMITLRTGEPCRDVIMGVHKPSGELTWISVNSQPVRPTSVGGGGVVCSFADITERKLADDEKAELEAQLHHTDKLKSLGVLAGGIAHDFNNILQTVLGHAAIARDEIPHDSPAQESIAAIELGARRAAELAGQMLAFAGRGRVVSEPISLDLLATEITELLRASVPHQIELRLVLDSVGTTVHGDPAQLRQVLLNLVTNAADAIGDRPGQITLATRRRTIATDHEIECVLGLAVGAGDYVELSVSDTGVGMDEQTRQLIFEPFFTTKATGRGLGLAAAAGIVRAHGGALELESEPGSGSTFSVLLPVSGAALDPAERTRDAVQAGGGLVLVIDDEASVRIVVSRMLERFGYSALTAENGAEARAILADHPEVLAVTLDVTMPGTTASELIAGVRRSHPDLPIILMSGYSEDVVPAGENLTFIQKPFAPEDLVRRLQQIVARG